MSGKSRTSGLCSQGVFLEFASAHSALAKAFQAGPPWLSIPTVALSSMVRSMMPARPKRSSLAINLVSIGPVSHAGELLPHHWRRQHLTEPPRQDNSPQLVKSFINPGHGAIGAVKTLTATLAAANHNVLTESENGWPDHETAKQFPPRSDSDFLSGLIEHMATARSIAC